MAGSKKKTPVKRKSTPRKRKSPSPPSKKVRKTRSRKVKKTSRKMPVYLPPIKKGKYSIANSNFEVDVKGKVAIVYNDQGKKLKEFKFTKLFTGTKEDESFRGETLLLYIGKGEYVVINDKIFSFKIGNEPSITKFRVNMGNSHVPYAYAKSKKYIYFLIAGAKGDAKDFDEFYDPYEIFYDNHKKKTDIGKRIKPLKTKAIMSYR